MSDHIVLALDADYEVNVRCVVMPCCGFTFSADHSDDGVEPKQYTCPVCAPIEAIKDLRARYGEHDYTPPPR